MAVGPKHGMWFDFVKHMDIHEAVLSSFERFMVTPTKYAITWDKEDEVKHSVLFDLSVNGYEIKITKVSKVSFRTHNTRGKIPDKAKTIEFNYVAYNNHKNHMIRYCSPHSDAYEVGRPWHHKVHRHEEDGGVNEVLIYSADDRPYLDRFKKNFQIKTKNIKIAYSNTEWPNLSEFLNEAYGL